MDIDLDVKKELTMEELGLIAKKTMLHENVEDAAFSISNLKKICGRLMETANQMYEVARKHRATSKNKELTVEMGAQVKKIASIFDKKRKEAKKPYLDHGKQIDGAVMPLIKTMNEIEKLIGEKHAKVLHKERMEKIEAEKRAAEQAKKIAGKKGDPPQPPPQAPAPARTHTETGSAGLIYVPEFKLTDTIDKVAPAYLLLDERKLRKAYKNGARGKDIKGIEIIEVPATQFNTKRG